MSPRGLRSIAVEAGWPERRGLAPRSELNRRPTAKEALRGWLFGGYSGLRAAWATLEGCWNFPWKWLVLQALEVAPPAGVEHFALRP